MLFRRRRSVKRSALPGAPVAVRRCLGGKRDARGIRIQRDMFLA